MCNEKCGGCKTGSLKKTPAEINSYYDGLGDGVYMYAWWKDGVQYVGTTGRTCKDALAQVEEERAKELAK